MTRCLPAGQNSSSSSLLKQPFKLAKCFSRHFSSLLRLERGEGRAGTPRKSLRLAMSVRRERDQLALSEPDLIMNVMCFFQIEKAKEREGRRNGSGYSSAGLCTYTKTCTMYGSSGHTFSLLDRRYRSRSLATASPSPFLLLSFLS